MLVDIQFDNDDPIAQMIAKMNQSSPITIRLQKGVYLSGHWNFGHMIMGKVDSDPEFSPNLAEFRQKLHIRNPDQYEPYTGPSIEILEKLNKIDTSKLDEDDYDGPPHFMSSYGVVDSIEQLLGLYDFESDPRNLVISMVSVKRENQDPRGGWRYHKWGPYYGTQNPQYEYLYDDTHIDEVFTFSVYEILEEN